MAPTTRSRKKTRPRKTQLQLLLESEGHVDFAVADALPQVADALHQDPDEEVILQDMCPCPREPSRRHRKCWRLLSAREALLRANYACARTGNAMAHGMHHWARSTRAPRIGEWAAKRKRAFPVYAPFHSAMQGSVLRRLRRRAPGPNAFKKTCMSPCQNNYLDLVKLTWTDTDASRNIFRAHGILPSEGDVRCNEPTCQGAVMRRFVRASDNHVFWQCQRSFMVRIPKEKPKREWCNNKQSDTKGTIMEKRKMSADQVLCFMQEFCQKHFTAEAAADKCKISDTTAYKLKNHLEDICAATIAKQPKQIGGPGVVVEIDETITARKKKSVNPRIGKTPALSTTWCVGAVERYGSGAFIRELLVETPQEDGSVIIEPERRTKEVLMSKVLEYIRPGSIIMRDKWRSYDSVEEYPRTVHHRFKYKSYAVNHSVEYVSKDNPWVHTQNIERYWLDVKSYIKRPGMKRKNMRRYIGRYLVVNPRGPRCYTRLSQRQQRRYKVQTALHRLLEATESYYEQRRN